MNNTFILLIGIFITLFATLIGSCLVFFIKKELSPKATDIINGASAGIMISATIFGLILPSFSLSSNLKEFYFLPAIVGIVIGSFFLLLTDAILLLITKNKQSNPTLNSKKATHLWLAFSLHNIPEGLAIGFAFGNAINAGTSAAYLSALSLSIAIAIQNIPEGLVVALPIFSQTKSKSKSFLFSILCGIIEPIFAIAGIFVATKIQFLMPWLLCFAAGTIIFVTIDDILPESKHSPDSHIGAYSFIFGFLLMMSLNILLG